ncbi:hypothetical protein EPUS_03542 [Endocarpon pusillum Z07020]|uniref:Uncharacterized protein n=1 Tax=Endocarpon pusillum (strain Z07020 / HMAS-L-300199) TaxID=1263415 RepID=U1HIF6_ENDPU|nr:uncharacterized protein EPUS_03542 [Endocarpon pusillum Z07020]ERF69990.1 hypothetical protein EPUS_03542 [Endocarpon pusillum Z07020]
MLSFGKIILAVTAVLATLVSASPEAQDDALAPINAGVQAIETEVPETQVYQGTDPGPVPVPKTTASPTPSPRFTAPVNIVEDI